MPRLTGRYQIANAAAAITAVRAAGFEVDHARSTGRWRASMAWSHAAAAGRPAAAPVPRGAEVWIDGGHNPGAGTVIAEALAEQEERHPRPLFLISGMINTNSDRPAISALAGMRHAHGAGHALHAGCHRPSWRRRPPRPVG